MILVARFSFSLFLFLSYFCFFTGCKESPPLVIRGKTMGTTYMVKYNSSPNSPSLLKLKERLEERLELVNQSLSTHRDDSEISIINRAGKQETFILSPLMQKALALSFVVYKKSDGFFDPGVGPLVNLWGHGPKRHNNPPSRKQIVETLSFSGLRQYKIADDFTKLTKLHSSAYLDFSASAKGLGVDELGAVLEGFGIQSYMVEIGGDVLVKSFKEGKKWRIGIERPINRGRGSIQAILSLQNGALATSGNYRNYYIKDGKRYGHTLNPHTGDVSPDDLLSASVIHKNCILADAWATALLAMGKKRAILMARKLGLKAFFIVSGEKGLEEVATPSWPPMKAVKENP